MPSIKDHQSRETVKLLFMGDSGAGKTGALMSLAAAGYNLRILDLDNGIDIIKNYATDPTSPYYKADKNIADRIQFVTLTDAMRNLNGKLVPAKVTVWPRVMSMLTEWKEGKEGEEGYVNLGKLKDWTPQEVLVIDSLSMLSTAAMNWHLSTNALLGQNRSSNEGRRDIGVAQNMLRDFLNLIFDDSIKCNIILTCHIQFVDATGGKPITDEKGVLQNESIGYPASIGRALSPHIPRYFNSVLLAKPVGVGAGIRHKIYTRSQSIGGQVVSAKTSAPTKVAQEYPIETGLADYFKAVRG